MPDLAGALRRALAPSPGRWLVFGALLVLAVLLGGALSAGPRLQAVAYVLWLPYLLYELPALTLRGDLIDVRELAIIVGVFALELVYLYLLAGLVETGVERIRG